MKLVRGGREPAIAFEPRVAIGHVFRLLHRGGRWVLVELDGPDPG